MLLAEEIQMPAGGWVAIACTSILGLAYVAAKVIPIYFDWQDRRRAQRIADGKADAELLLSHPLYQQMKAEMDRQRAELDTLHAGSVAMALREAECQRRVNDLLQRVAVLEEKK